MTAKHGSLRRIISLIALFSLVFQQLGFAQVATEMNMAGYFSRLQSSLAVDKFRPEHLRYFSYNLSDRSFTLLLDKGDLKEQSDSNIKASGNKLLNYFLAGLTLPNESFWVNLRPDSPDQIIDSSLALTDVGKILLEADLQLKKDTAACTSPKTPEGRAYWGRLYKKAGELFGNENISIPTLTRPWIVPGEIIVRQTKDSAYIYKANLKVMLEQDHLKNSLTYNFADPRLKELNEYSSQLIRELIIPKLTREVNNSQRYAQLRQVYYSLILARWFKQAFGNTGSTANADALASFIDSRDLRRVASRENWDKGAYFRAYQKSFKDGEYNVREPASTPYGQTIRSYFSGGIAFNEMGSVSSPVNGFIIQESKADLLKAAGAGVVQLTGTTAEGIAIVNLPVASSPVKPNQPEKNLPADIKDYIADIELNLAKLLGNNIIGIEAYLAALYAGFDPNGRKQISSYQQLADVLVVIAGKAEHSYDRFTAMANDPKEVRLAEEFNGYAQLASEAAGFLRQRAQIILSTLAVASREGASSPVFVPAVGQGVQQAIDRIADIIMMGTRQPGGPLQLPREGFRNQLSVLLSGESPSSLSVVRNLSYVDSLNGRRTRIDLVWKIESPEKRGEKETRDVIIIGTADLGNGESRARYYRPSDSPELAASLGLLHQLKQSGMAAASSPVTPQARVSAKLEEIRENSGLPVLTELSQLPETHSDNELWREALRALHFTQPVFRRVELEGKTQERFTGKPIAENVQADPLIRQLNVYDVSQSEFYSIRTGDQVRGFITDPAAELPLEAYFMHRGVFASREDVQKAFIDNLVRYDITVIPPAIWGVDFAKTVGHYHDPIEMPEVYQVVSGEALWLMQKLDDQGNVADFVTVKAKAGDIAIMLPGYGHVSVNISQTEPLVLANWLTWHQSSQYGSFKDKGGAAYYVVRSGAGEPVLVPNPKYQAAQDLPQPRQMVSKDQIPAFGLTRGKPIYDLVHLPAYDFMGKVKFLNFPDYFSRRLTVEATLDPAGPAEQLRVSGTAASSPVEKKVYQNAKRVVPDVAADNPFAAFARIGQYIWQDGLTIEMIESGDFEKRVAVDGINGVTTNPTLIKKYLESPKVQEKANALAGQGRSREEIYREIVSDLARMVLAIFKKHEAKIGNYHFSVELDPSVNNSDVDKAVAEAMFWTGIDPEHMMIKVAVTSDAYGNDTGIGYRIIEDVIARGRSVNATLIFTPVHYRRVAQAYIRGLQRALNEARAGRLGKEEFERIYSVASFFISRWDVRLEEKKLLSESLRGRAANAITTVAYNEIFLQLFSVNNPDWMAIVDGAAAIGIKVQVQDFLLASTGSKGADMVKKGTISDEQAKLYPADIYVAPVQGDHVVNTLPSPTLGYLQQHPAEAVETIIGGYLQSRLDWQTLSDHLTDDGTSIIAQGQEILKAASQSFVNDFNAVQAQIEAMITAAQAGTQTSASSPAASQDAVATAVDRLADQVVKYYRIAPGKIDLADLKAEIRRFLLGEGDDFRFSLGLAKSTDGLRFISVAYLTPQGKVYKDESLEGGLMVIPEDLFKILEATGITRRLAASSPVDEEASLETVSKVVDILADAVVEYYYIKPGEIDLNDLKAEIRRFLLGEGKDFRFSLGLAQSQGVPEDLFHSRPGETVTKTNYMSVAYLTPQGKVYNEPNSVEMGLTVMPEGLFEMLKVIGVPRRLGIASSPVRSVVPEKTGGIDFRQMAIIAQPMGNFTGLNFNLPRIANVEGLNLDAELAQLNQMVSSGIMPSEERIAEYLAACYQKEELPAHRDEIVGCLVNICKLQETQVAETSQRLKELLVLADTI